jgi:RNA polymerase sigma-70 factor, ECF subfamily
MIEAEWEPGLEPSPRAAESFCGASADPDFALVLQLQEGNGDAFAALVGKYKRPLVNFAARALGDPMEAQDVAQNAFIRVFKESRRFRFACKFSTWLYTIVRNLCRNELRRRSRHRADSLAREEVERPQFARWQSDAAKLGNVPEAVFRRELHEKIEQGLAALPERERAALLLVQDERLSYQEVAAILKTSQAATRMLIHRGRQTMKRELRPYLRITS